MVNLKFWKKEIIEFYINPKFYGVFPEPRPSNKFLPDWFKRISPYTESRDKIRAKSLTAKKCMPLLDVMSAGYIIPLVCDTHIKTNSTGSILQSTSSEFFRTVEFHSHAQLGDEKCPGYPSPPVKWINPWVIKTAPGWSSLIITPINHMNPNFTCLGGLVDTDKYPKEINFPAIWNTKNFDDVIPAGTPLVQVIPIKRDAAFAKTKPRKMSEKEFEIIDEMQKILSTRRSYYSEELRVKK